MDGCESWTIKKAERRRIDAFELWCWRRLFESPLDSKEIQPVHPKGNQSWIFIGRPYAEAETPILWPPDEELTHWKRPWCWERLKAGEGDGRGWDGWWYHRLNGHEFEQAPGVGNGQGSLLCCSPCGCKESDTTEWLNWTEQERKNKDKEMSNTLKGIHSRISEAKATWVSDMEDRVVEITASEQSIG